jgi:hypothetical protein
LARQDQKEVSVANKDQVFAKREERRNSVAIKGVHRASFFVRQAGAVISGASLVFVGIVKLEAVGLQKWVILSFGLSLLGLLVALAVYVWCRVKWRTA